MHYVISDIHGCYEEFIELLEKIHFSDEDTLYVLGDMIDRGPYPMKVLDHVSKHFNMIPMVGNHEMMMLDVVLKLMKEVNEDNIKGLESDDFLNHYYHWMRNGGSVTLDQFQALSEEDREFILEMILDLDVAIDIEINGKKYMIVHSVPSDFTPEKDLDSKPYRPYDIVWGRPEFHQDWNQEIHYIVGHTPTVLIKDAKAGKIFQRGNLTNIDCGCFIGLSLCAYCLETEEAIYVDSHQELLIKK